jgi:hypothetical protein
MARLRNLNNLNDLKGTVGAPWPACAGMTVNTGMTSEFKSLVAALLG